MKRSTGCIILAVFLSVVLSPLHGQSLLWKISGKNLPAPSYVYGTIHIADARVFEWRDSVFDYLKQCELFAGELDLSMENMMKAASMMLLPAGTTLHDRFNDEEYQIIQEGLRDCSGFDLSMFNQVKPPALIAMCFSVKRPGDMEATVDEILYTHARSAGLQVTGIETVEEQMKVFDMIPERYVVDYFLNIHETGDEMETLVRNYRKADLDSLLILMQDEESGSLMTKELIEVRNHRMAERIISMIQKQAVFAAIGGGHLPGKDGVIALLRREGYEVEPVVLKTGYK